MAKFIYKMQNILEIKYKLEEQAKTFYSEARAKLDREEEKLTKLKQRKEIYQQKLKMQMDKELNISEIKRYEDAVEIMKVEIRYQIIYVKQAEKELELARIKLQEIMIDRKTHEKLRENAFEDFKKEINSQEQKEIDELVSYQYNKSTDSEEDI